MDKLREKLSECSLPAALEAVGERWSFLILRASFNGLHHFEEFLSELGIARNILADRLGRMVRHSILGREPCPDDRRKVEYRLTEKGFALLPTMIALRQWGDEWIYGPGNEPLIVEHRGCGCTATAHMTCSGCGETLDARSVRALPGPGAGDDAVRPLR